MKAYLLLRVNEISLILPLGSCGTGGKVVTLVIPRLLASTQAPVVNILEIL